MCELDEKLRAMLGTKHTSTAHVHQLAVNFAQDLEKDIATAGIKQEDATKYLLDTGYFLVHGLDKKTVKEAKFFAPEVYKKAKPYIEAMAKAFNNKSGQTGYYMNNAELIAAKIGVEKEDIPAVADLIREMAVDHAMTDEAWKFVEKYKDTKFLKDSMRLLGRMRQKSESLIFSNNISSLDDAYLVELHRSGKDIEGKLETEVGYHEGLFTVDLEQAKVGKRLSDKVQPPKGLSGDELYRWAEKNNVKITEKGQYRRVATQEERKNLGISRKFTDIVSETYKSVANKENERSVTSMILNHIDNDGSLISKEAKDGFTEIDKDLSRRLPLGLKQKKLYINDKFMTDIVGREPTRLLGNTKTDKLLRDLVTFYKKNTVVLNPKSTINAWGWTLATVAMEAMTSPVQASKALAVGFTAEKQLRSHKKMLARAIKEGRKREENQARRLIAENPMHKYQSMGLATDLVDGISSQRTMIDAALSNFNNQTTAKKIAANIFAKNGTYMGNLITREFSRADSVGRFAVAYLIDKGGEPTVKAAQMANDNFADMSKIPSPLVEVLDRYPIVPFLQWFLSTAGGVGRTVRRKPVESMIVFAALYALAENNDLDLDGINPIQTVVDESEDKLKGLGFVDYGKSFVHDPIDRVVRDSMSTFLPAPWQKVLHDQFFLNEEIEKEGGEPYTVTESIGRATYQKKRKRDLTKYMGYDMRGLTQELFEDMYPQYEGIGEQNDNRGSSR